MIGMIVTGHGHFATGILSTLRLIAGEQEAVAGVDFLEEYSVEELKNYLLKEMDKLGDEIIVFADLEGGSPFNKSVELKMEGRNKKVEVLAGTNFPMLLTAVMGRDSSGMEELVEEIMETGRESITKFVFAVPKQKEIEEEDGI